MRTIILIGFTMVALAINPTALDGEGSYDFYAVVLMIGVFGDIYTTVTKRNKG